MLSSQQGRREGGSPINPVPGEDSADQPPPRRFIRRKGMFQRIGWHRPSENERRWLIIQGVLILGGVLLIGALLLLALR